jgi:hypothetical protein
VNAAASRDTEITTRVFDALELREALDRLSRVNGPGELHAAILALISPRESAESFIVWTHETVFSPDASLIRQDITKLPDDHRVPVLEVFLDRMRTQPKEDRRGLLQATRRLVAVHSPMRPLDRLHWLLMRRKLGDRPPIPLPPQSHNDLAELSKYMIGRIASVTAYLARMVPGPDARAGLPWYTHVMSQLDHSGHVPPCKAPDGDGLAHALDEVESLPLMLRPVLMRGWADAAISTSGRVRLMPMAADALRIVADLLDSPLPPELARHFTELDWK